jgi:UDP-N-acetylmuramoyl-tripeptide--D-alanyl-D-alanine ligase
MMPAELRLHGLAAELGLRVDVPDRSLGDFIIDSRKVTPGSLFIALVGAREDGHRYVEAAAAAGAAAALVRQRQASALPQLVVDDPLRALQQFAARWRQAYAAPVIGVTGSNGKTTTKHLLRQICAARGEVLATEGNLNNHIGVPLTLVRLRPSQATAVIEMGANHAGEIAQLSAWAQPDIAIVTQAGDAHLEGFGSRDGVAHAKGEIYAALRPGGTAVINADDAYAGLWHRLAGGAEILRFGLSPEAEVTARDIQIDASRSRFLLQTPAGQAPVRLPLPGQHNILNALAAAAAGHALGLPVATLAERLGDTAPVAGRLRLLTAVSGACVADDSYNANPDSMRAGIDWLARQPGQRWAVLGHMAELGPDSPERHRALGRYAAERRLDRCIAVGPQAAGIAEGFGAGAVAVADTAAALSLLGHPGPDVTLLVKGSRSARMEAVVEALTTRQPEETH